MHDMRITLYLHKFAHLHAARGTNAPDIVASEIDEHHMFRALFGIAFQFLGEPLVALAVSAAWTCTGKRANRHLVVLEAYQQFRRGADDMKIAQVKVEHIW